VIDVASKKDNHKTDKEKDGRFHSKNIKHEPQAESARAVYGLKSEHTEEP
jgi:hypothetical protein